MVLLDGVATEGSVPIKTLIVHHDSLAVDYIVHYTLWSLPSTLSSDTAATKLFVPSSDHGRR
jgi:hypothetical protein